MDDYDPLLISRRAGRAAADGLTRAEARSALYVSPMHGVLRPAFVQHDELTTRISDAVALLGPTQALGGWAALRVQGNQWFSDQDPDGNDRLIPIHCEPGGQLRRRAQVEPWRGLVLPGEIVDLGEYRVASIARATFDEMRRARGWREAVVALDMAISTTNEAPHATKLDVTEVIARHRKVRGVVQADKAVGYASARSASPLETRTRLVATVDAGLQGLLVNAPIFDLGGALLGVGDLVDPATGHVIESDGAVHREAQKHAVDNVREEGFEHRGLVVSRVTTHDHRDRKRLSARLRSAHEHARRTTRAVDWTLDPPAWWKSWPPALRWQ